MKSLELAEYFLDEARSMLHKARQQDSGAGLQNAAHKGWLSMIKVADAFLERKGYRIKKNWGSEIRQRFLRELADQEKRLDGPYHQLARVYGSVMTTLHVKAGYNGYVSAREIERDFDEIDYAISLVRST
jgi:hypothetical protein